MAYETVTIERDRELPGLMMVTLNRPEKLNAINVQMHDDLQQVCRELQDDYETRVVILTGAGRAFSAGADLSSVRAGQPPGDLDRRLRVHIGGRTSAMLERLDQVTSARSTAWRSGARWCSRRAWICASRRSLRGSRYRRWSLICRSPGKRCLG